MDDSIKKKNCVILHSKRHFDPDCESELDESSAARVAKEVYNAAIENATHNVFYYDLFETSEWVKMPVDVLISLVDNRNLAIWFFKPNKSYVIAVNRNPVCRLEILDDAKKRHIPADALTDSDGILQSYKKLNSATEIACVGNDYVAQSYRNYFSALKVTNSYYGSNFFERNHTSKKNSETKQLRILVLASSIGFRKGADLLIDLVEITREDNIIFDVLGVPELAYWRDRLQEATKVNSHLLLHGWVSNKSTEFNDFLIDANAAIFLSREEGLLGSLIECITRGTPSFHGLQSGLNPSDNTFDISHLNVSQIRDQLITFLMLSPQEQRFQTNKQKTSMDNQFDEWTSLNEIISRWLNSPSPKYRRNYRLIPDGIESFRNLKRVFRRRRYWRIYLLRVKILFIRYQLDKISIFSPSTFLVLRKIKKLFFRLLSNP